MSKIYYFDSERFLIGKSSFGNNEILASNASNLPEVLHTLQARNPERFNKYNEVIREIFPEIHKITVDNINGQQVEIKIWTIDPKTERSDLCIPLEKSGTGIGQILALLYVVINSNFERTIIIDEPQSFLHPGAIRKLLEILNRYPQNQYIMATHSSTIISTAKNASIILLDKEDYETNTEKIDKNNLNHIKTILDKIGVKISDIFGADNIIWVEGPTEEIAFKLIFDKLLKIQIPLTQVCSVKNTGDFTGKKANLVFDIYDTLSGGNRVIPPAICFIFDNENKAEKEKEDIKRKATKPVYFLEKVMFENYLLQPKAILSIIVKRAEDIKKEIKDFELSNKLDENEIVNWMKKNFNNKVYYKNKNLKEDDISNFDYDSDEWKKEIHGSNFLKDLFQNIFGSRYSYNKINDSVELLEWLIENDPDYLNELKKFLYNILIENSIIKKSISESKTT